MYEINGLDDWARLVARYPVRVEAEPLELTAEVTLPAPLFLPDWIAVASEWDVVRLTMRGVLSALYVPVELDGGYTLIHQDQSAEERVWLNWSFS